MLQKYTHTRYIANLIYINSIINVNIADFIVLKP